MATVLGLVYAAAFSLDEGESLGALLSQGPVTPALAHKFTDQRGFVWLSEEDFVGHFAGDLDRPQARVMWAVQQALAESAFTDVMGIPASHVAMVSRADEVASLIERAAESVGASAVG